MSNIPPDYDYIFAGAGAAGLSLAYRIATEPSLAHKKILLIDNADKQHNDRTWSFWAKSAGGLAPVIYHQWDKMWFHTTRLSQRLDLDGYHYFTIRSIDFYRFTREAIRHAPNITWLHGSISHITPQAQGAAVWVNGEEYTAEYVFNSLPAQQMPPAPYYAYLQHFLGWVIETQADTFTHNAATFMDFRVPQVPREARFVYILPFSARRALVEYTVFSDNLWDKQTYARELQHYLHTYLGLGEGDIVDTEYGVIPMFDIPYAAQNGKHIINIGTAGGQTRASTGFTFHNIQRHSAQLLKQLCATKPPSVAAGLEQRFRFYDSMLFNVLQQGKYLAADLFERMFERHPVGRVLRFLDNESSLAEELRIMASMPAWAFLKALPRELPKILG